MIANWLGAYDEIFPSYGKPITPERCELYSRLLRDLPTPTLQLAMERAARECKEFPTPGHIGQIAEQQRETWRAAGGEVFREALPPADDELAAEIAAAAKRMQIQ